MAAIFVGLLFGFGAVGLAAKAFHPSGIPLPGDIRLQGTSAHIAGTVCLLFGVGMVRYWGRLLFNSLLLQAI
jgi:hypothetical protein